MKMYAFYGVTNEKFIGLIKTKEERDAILLCRPKDFHVIKIDYTFGETFYVNNAFYLEDFGQGVRCYITEEERELINLYIMNRAGRLKGCIRRILYYVQNIEMSNKDRKCILPSLVYLDRSLTWFLENGAGDMLFLQASEIFDMKKLLKDFFDLKRQDEEMTDFVNRALY